MAFGGSRRCDQVLRTAPAVNVSWNDAKQYVAWLSRVTQRAYRLPNEAEWEYAARAGVATAYFWGDTMSDGWANCHGCGQRDLMRTAPVGSFKPNVFGLFDTHGNVWEWCEDVWHDNYAGAPRTRAHGRKAAIRTIVLCAAARGAMTRTSCARRCG